MSRDERVKVMSEILESIKYIKCNAQEESYINILIKKRNKELIMLFKQFTLSFIYVVFLYLAPLLTLNSIIFVYIYNNNEITAATIFTLVSVLLLLKEPINQFPYAFISII